MIRWGVLFALAVCSAIAVTCTQPLSAEVINVLVLDHDASSDAGFGVGGRYQDAYNDMMNASNFGASGVASYSFNFMTSVSSLSGVSLDNVGLVILAHSHLKSTTFDDAVKVSNFVYHDGGSVLALGHSFSDIESNSHARLSNWWSGHGANSEHTWPYRNPEGDNMTVNAVGSGPASGAFGDVQLTTVRSDVNQYWSQSGTSGTFAISYNGASGDGLYGDYGDGRYMMIGSVNMIGDGDIGTSMIGSRYNEGSNSTFFLNTVDYLAANVAGSSAGATATPEPSSFILIAAGGLAVLVRHRKRRRAVTTTTA